MAELLGPCSGTALAGRTGKQSLVLLNLSITHASATELFVSCPGLFGQVIIMVSTPSGHLPM